MSGRKEELKPFLIRQVNECRKEKKKKELKLFLIRKDQSKENECRKEKKKTEQGKKKKKNLPRKYLASNISFP